MESLNSWARSKTTNQSVANPRVSRECPGVARLVVPLLVLVWAGLVLTLHIAYVPQKAHYDGHATLNNSGIDRIRGPASPKRTESWNRPLTPPKPSNFNCDKPWNLIVSFGGVGSTNSIRAMASSTQSLFNDLDDREGLKHRPFATTMERIQELRVLWGCEAQGPKPIHRVVYIYAQPIQAIVSLYRRTYIFEQFEKVPKTPMDRLDAWRAFPTLKEFAESGDPLGIEHHFDSWMAGGGRCFLSHQNSTTPFVFFVDSRLLSSDSAVREIVRFLGTDGPPPKLSMIKYVNSFNFEDASRYRAYMKSPEKMLNISKEEMMMGVVALERTYDRLVEKMKDLQGASLIACRNDAVN